MLIQREAPATDRDLSDLYARLPNEGMVFSSTMCGEAYELAGTFESAWCCPAVTWLSGGKERYLFENGRVIDLQHTGVMTIAEGDRYAYRAGNAPFISNMVVFPRSVTRRVEFQKTVLETRLIRSDRVTESLLQSIATSCRSQVGERSWYHEQLVSLYRRLVVTQQEIDNASSQVCARKAKTKELLTSRADRAQQYMLENLHKPELSVSCIASEACLSPSHLIRTFKAVTGLSPMQYLQSARATAALRMLKGTDLPVAEICRCVGYSDRTAFTRSFRRQYGVAPSSMRGR